MLASDLTDDDIGKDFWVKGALTGNWSRIVYEGTTVKPAETLSAGPSAVNGGEPYFLILRCAPQSGVQRFRTPSGVVFAGLLVRATTDVVPVNVLWAVTADGQIIEVGETAA